MKIMREGERERDQIENILFISILLRIYPY
jgi:hypothetical protein